jgi:hypothetical protein
VFGVNEAIVAGQVGVVCWREQFRSFHAGEVVGCLGLGEGSPTGAHLPSRDCGSKVMEFST